MSPLPPQRPGQPPSPADTPSRVHRRDEVDTGPHAALPLQCLQRYAVLPLLRLCGVWIIIDKMRRPCQWQMVAGLGMAKVRLSLQTLSRPQHVVAGTVRYSAVLYSTAGHLWHSADALYSSSTVLYCTHTMYCIWAHEVQGLDPNCR